MTDKLDLVYASFKKDGIEIFINTETGESFCSLGGYCRLSGKSKSTIFTRLARRQKKGFVFDANYGLKTLDVQGLEPVSEESTDREYFQVSTNGGQQTARLVDEEFIAEWLPQDNPKRASDLLRFGIRKALHQMAGYEQSSTSSQVQISPAESIRSAIAAAKTMQTSLTTWVVENPGAAVILKELMPDLPIAISPTPVAPASPVVQTFGETEGHPAELQNLLHRLKVQDETINQQSLNANRNGLYTNKLLKVIAMLERGIQFPQESVTRETILQMGEALSALQQDNDQLQQDNDRLKRALDAQTKALQIQKKRYVDLEKRKQAGRQDLPEMRPLGETRNGSRPQLPGC